MDWKAYPQSWLALPGQTSWPLPIAILTFSIALFVIFIFILILPSL